MSNSTCEYYTRVFETFRFRLASGTAVPFPLPVIVSSRFRFFCESSYIVDTVVVVLAMCCTFAGDAATLLPVASQHVQGL